MILAVDVGNSDMVFGLYDGQSWIHEVRIPSDQYVHLANQIDQKLRDRNIEWKSIQQTVVSSVVPAVTPVMMKVLSQRLAHAPLLLGPDFYRTLPVTIFNPEEIGSDLVANSFGAFHLIGRASIVVDFGTALTFSMINDIGEIEGVAIAPGLKTAVNSLFQKAAQLPEVPLDWPDSAIGKGTTHALQAGILMGYVGLVRELIRRIREEKNAELPVVATGGLSEVLTPLKDDFHTVDRTLTLDGLRIMAGHHSSIHPD